MNIQVEHLYDHYKDTFSQIQKYIKYRDKYFFSLIIITGLLLMLLNDPKELTSLVNSFIQEKAGDKILIDFSVINTSLIFSYLAVIIKYIQINLLIDNQYNYIHNIESKFKYNNSAIITREGSNYFKEYPLVKNLIHYCYTLVVPILLVFFSVFKIGQELSVSSLAFLNVMNIIFCVLTIILLILYLLHLHRKITISKPKFLHVILISLICFYFIVNVFFDVAILYQLIFFILIVTLLIYNLIYTKST